MEIKNKRILILLSFICAILMMGGCMKEDGPGDISSPGNAEYRDVNGLSDGTDITMICFFEVSLEKTLNGIITQDFIFTPGKALVQSTDDEYMIIKAESVRILFGNDKELLYTRREMDKPYNPLTKENYTLTGPRNGVARYEFVFTDEMLKISQDIGTSVTDIK